MTKARGVVLPILLVTAALVGCQRAEPAKTVAAAPTVVAAVVPPLSINEMMVMIVDRPGELLWDVEKAGQGPKTAEDWYLLESHAVDLAGAATLIRIGGTGPKDAAWVKEPGWQAAAQQLSDAAVKARRAADGKDMDALIAANGEIVAACESCHKQFKPDIPTGGLFMHQRPAGVPARRG